MIRFITQTDTELIYGMAVKTLKTNLLNITEYFILICYSNNCKI